MEFSIKFTVTSQGVCLLYKFVQKIFWKEFIGVKAFPDKNLKVNLLQKLIKT